MKSFYGYLSLLFLFLEIASPATSRAQWVQTNGPYGGYVNCIATDPHDSSIIAVGTNLGGVYLSTDGGSSWTRGESVGGSPNVAALAFSGSTILLGQPSIGGSFSSTDYGRSWVRTNNGIANAQITCLAVTDSFVYAGTYSGVYISSDGGLNWTQASSGPGAGIVQYIDVIGSDVFAATQGGGLYLSSDRGASWSTADNGMSNASVMCLAVRDSDIYAATGGGGIFLSTDNGADWSPLNNGISNLNVYSIAFTDSVMVAGGDGGIFRSTDLGLNWSASDSGLAKKAVTAVASVGSKVLAGLTLDGLWVSTDTASSWTQLPLAVPIVSSLAIHDTTVYAGTQDGGLYISRDNVNGWVSMNRGYMTDPSINCIDVNWPNIYVGTLSLGIFLTTDNGADWTQLTNNANGNTGGEVMSFATGNTYLFDGSVNGVFRSGDNGASWSPLSNGIPNYAVPCLAVEDSNLFAVDGRGVYVSSDQGDSWKETYTTNQSIESMTHSGPDVFFGTYRGNLFTTSDNGSHWREVDNGLPHARVYSLAVVDSVVIAGTGDGVFVSPDKGRGWTRAGLAAENIYSLTVGDSSVFAGTDTGVWRAPFLSLNRTVLPTPALAGPDSGFVTQGDSVAVYWKAVTGAAFYRLELAYDSDFVKIFLDTSSVTQTSFKATGLTADTSYYWRVSAWDSLGASAWSDTREFVTPTLTSLKNAQRNPHDYALLQNYPNPFNPTTEISYQLSALSHVSLEVFDVLGRKVATLVNDEVQKAGSYEVRFDGSRLPSGVYFYRLQAGAFSAVKKLIILK